MDVLGDRYTGLSYEHEVTNAKSLSHTGHNEKEQAWVGGYAQLLTRVLLTRRCMPLVRQALQGPQAILHKINPALMVAYLTAD